MAECQSSYAIHAKEADMLWREAANVLLVSLALMLWHKQEVVNHVRLADGRTLQAQLCA